MKQYRFKIDTPRNKMGSIADICTDRKFMAFGRVYLDGKWVKPEDYLDIFEEIEVKSDAEIFIDWCKAKGILGYGIATTLLSENAINPEWLKKLRGE